MMGGFGGGMGWGWIWPLVLVVGLALLAWGLFRARSARGGDGAGRDDRPQGMSHDRAREIVRERYARGEISEEEMRAQMRALDE